jgi:hypothetical protein
MERKKIIIDEIKYWKESRLLPEQYCNFLLSLYTEGEETGTEKVEKGNSAVSFLPLLITTFGLAIFGLTFLVIYFTDFSPVLQIGLVIIFSALMFLVATQVKRVDHRFVHFYILLGALMFFIATIEAVNFIFPNQPQILLAAVFFTCLLWLVIGKKYKLIYFMISGAIGIAIVVYFLFK